MKRILLILIASFISSAYADAPYTEVPNFTLTQSIITLPTNIRGFSGPKPDNSTTISYPLPTQSFLSSPVRLDIPKAGPDLNDIPQLTRNPYSMLLSAVKLNSIGDTSGIITLAAPEDKDAFKKVLSGPFIEVTKKLLQGKNKIELLLAISENEKIVIFYKLVDQSGIAGKADFFFVLKNINGQYLFDCSPMSDHAVLNIFGTLYLKGNSGVKVGYPSAKSESETQH